MNDRREEEPDDHRRETAMTIKGSGFWAYACLSHRYWKKPQELQTLRGLGYRFSFRGEP